MEILWYVIGVAVCAILLAVGIIMAWYWLVLIGFIALPAAAVWGMVSSGPGSKHNPYHH